MPHTYFHSRSRVCAMRCSLVALAGVASFAFGCAAAPQPVPPSIIELSKNENPTTLVGEGRLSHAPEYIELKVTIQSECYATPVEASAATDAAATEIMALLRAAIDEQNPKDGVFSSGGFSRSFSRYINSNVTICQNTFQKTTQIAMKTSKIEAFAKQYDDIQRAVLSASLREPADKTKPTGITYASLGAPQTRLYYETRERLEQQALADALDNARAKFEATAKMACGIDGYRILRFNESNPDAGRPIAYGRSQRSSRSERGTALAFDAIWINKLLDVAFVATSGTCKPR